MATAFKLCNEEPKERASSYLKREMAMLNSFLNGVLRMDEYELRLELIKLSNILSEFSSRLNEEGR